MIFEDVMSHLLESEELKPFRYVLLYFMDGVDTKCYFDVFTIAIEI